MMHLKVAAALLCAALLAACQSEPRKDFAVSGEDRVKLAEINTQLAIAYMRDGDNELALRKLEKAIEADPRSVGAHTTLGLLHTRLGQHDAAERHYRAALDLDPGNTSALNNYGQFLCQQKRYEDGQVRFRQAVANPLNRTPALSHNNAGICALDADDKAAAEQSFRAALQLDPRLPPALLAMAQLSFDQANHLQARAYYQRYLEVGQQSPRTLWLGIRIEHALEDRDSVSSYAVQLKNRYPDSPEYGKFQRGEFD